MAKAIGVYTIADLNDGAPGNSAVQAVLSNESHTLTANSSGVPTSYTGASTTITVYEGSTNVTSQYTITKSDSSGVTSSLSGNTVSITNISNGVGGTVTITATKGTTVLNKVFAVSLSITGQTGAAGADAKVVNVSASSQVFKSTEGAAGTFSPQYIYLYPSFQNVTYSKWQYSTNGTTWTDVTSGQHSLTIGTYNSTANSLRIENVCDLYTDSITSISFKCVSSDANTYDIISVIKLYDVTDLQISGRNILLNSNNISYYDYDNTYLSVNGNIITVETAVPSSDEATAQVLFYMNDLSDPTFPYINYLTVDFDTLKNSGIPLTFSVDVTMDGFTSGSVSIAFFCWDGNSSGMVLDGETINYDEYPSDVSYIRLKNITIDPDDFPQSSVYIVGAMVVISGANAGAKVTLNKIKIEQSNISTDWTPAPEDNTGYATEEDLEILGQNRTKTFVDTPVPPYNVGDMWVVVDQTSSNYGKILTCVNSKTADGVYDPDDWIIPLSAYTTITQMTQVLGRDPSSWDVTQGTITQLLDEDRNEIIGLTSDVSKFAIRSSNIEMSFSKTGTMNFLANSSGQNKLEDWSTTNTRYVGVVNAADASDVRRSLVSGSAFYFDVMTGLYTGITSNKFVPPTSDQFVISFKTRIPVKYSYLTMAVRLWEGSDASTATLITTEYYRYPYIEGAEDTFVLYHEVIDRNNPSYNDKNISFADISLNVIGYSDLEVVALNVDPTTYAGKIDYAGRMLKYNNTYYYIKPIYRQLIINDFATEAQLSGLTLYGDHVYKCTNTILNQDESVKYLRGTYYTNRDDALQNILRPITDSYYITLLDADDLYFMTLTGGSENIETSASIFSVTPGKIYIGDIMVNGGVNVMTWTPRQDEVLWGENIKFSSNGIYIENKDNGFGRQLTSNSDIAFRLAGDGTITEYIWKLTQTGFIAKDIKCFGTFAMGNTTGSSADLENSFTSVLEMKRNNNNTGVDDYIYVN